MPVYAPRRLTRLQVQKTTLAVSCHQSDDCLASEKQNNTGVDVCPTREVWDESIGDHVPGEWFMAILLSIGV